MNRVGVDARTPSRGDERVVDRVVIVVHNHRVWPLGGQDSFGGEVGKEGVLQLAEVNVPDLVGEVGTHEFVGQPRLIRRVAPQWDPIDLELGPFVTTHAAHKPVDPRADLGIEPRIHDDRGDSHLLGEQVAPFHARLADLQALREAGFRPRAGGRHSDAVHPEHTVAANGGHLDRFLLKRVGDEGLGIRVLPDVRKRRKEKELHVAAAYQCTSGGGVEYAVAHAPWIGQKSMLRELADDDRVRRHGRIHDEGIGREHHVRADRSGAEHARAGE